MISLFWTHDRVRLNEINAKLPDVLPPHCMRMNSASIVFSTLPATVRV
jgi:hypothetical protein